jgi:predicted glycogen debranching enzyme
VTEPARHDDPGTPRCAAVVTGDPHALITTEWVLANGIGGFAMGTAAGVPARRYHGLLVASLSPPVRRVVAFSAVVDRLLLDPVPGGAGSRTIDLASFRFASSDPAHAAAGVLHPSGLWKLTAFQRTATGTVSWTWRDGPVEVVRTLHLYHGRNAAALRYTVRGHDGPWRLDVRPLAALRDFHHLIERGEDGLFDLESSSNAVALRRAAWKGGPCLRLAAPRGSFTADPQWWRSFRYDMELDRGMSGVEDLFSPGVFVLSGRGASGAALLAAVDEDPLALPSPEADENVRRRRVGAMIAAATDQIPEQRGDLREAAAHLAAAADDFLVARVAPGTRPASSPPASTVIAGYPWFADWGRDSMISLPGLCLVTGRHADALRILRTFASHRRDGLIPNRFDDDAGEPHYNSADAPLWFLHAACEYVRITGDRAGFDAHLRDACLEIVDAYRRGTRVPGLGAAVGMDPDDHLIAAGTETTQLTWMDAQRDGVVFTPRHGKPVELSALWYHGLLSLAEVLEAGAAEQRRVADLRELAEAVGESFRQRFVLEAMGWCADRLEPPRGAGGAWEPVAEMRPNQVFAASLRHSPLTPAQRISMIEAVRARLLTPHGLRTLDPAHPDYHGRFTGDLRARDAAYHTGTAWPWLLPALAEAQMRADAFSPVSRAGALVLLAPLLSWVRREGCGHIHEVFDGDDSPDRPQRPGGCPAQAWSAAEVLRVLVMAGGRAADEP